MQEEVLDFMLSINDLATDSLFSTILHFTSFGLFSNLLNRTISNCEKHSCSKN